jgi:hypothetical protein
MTLARNGFLDSLPLALYIIPLVIVIPILLRSYNESRAALFPLIIVLISTLILGVLSSLVRGFTFIIIANTLCVATVMIMGRFRVSGSKRELGRKGVAWLVFLNVIGLLFPISVVVMGQTPIASATAGDLPEITLEVPLSDFEFPFIDLGPTEQIVETISNNSLGLSFRINTSDSDAWLRLRDWLIALNETSIPSVVVLSPTRFHSASPGNEKLGTTDSIIRAIDELGDSIETLSDVIIEANRSQLSSRVIFDLTLSQYEWQVLMRQARQINIAGFAGVMRNTFESIDATTLLSESQLLVDAAESFGLSCGVLVESFVLDDYQDQDTIFMKSSGLTVESVAPWDTVQVSCSRSLFSYEMEGDVGEYLVHSYSSTIGGLGAGWEMRIGQAGNATDVLGRRNLVYTSLDQLAKDLLIAAANGVQRITVESLTGMISSFGENSIDEILSMMEDYDEVPITYTFRIYAFRAVLIAIDAFDPIMF